jgi:hypothetical protein
MTVPVPGPPPRPADPRESLDRRPLPAGDSPADPRDGLARAVAGLDGIADRPLAEHVEAFERVHAAMSDALAGPSGSG